MSDGYIRQLSKLCLHQGWSIDRTDHHLRFTSPTGAVVVTSVTPSDYRSYNNLRQWLREAGLQDRPKKSAKPAKSRRKPRSSSTNPPRPESLRASYGHVFSPVVAARTQPDVSPSSAGALCREPQPPQVSRVIRSQGLTIRLIAHDERKLLRALRSALDTTDIEREGGGSEG
jgi:hypothetical protein